VGSANSLKPQEPRRLSLGELSVLQPGEQIEAPVIIHAESIGKHELSLLFVFREVSIVLPVGMRVYLYIYPIG
jgi:hypothetical protein